MNQTRKDYMTGVRTVVVKLGSQLLTNREGRLDAVYVSTVARQIAALRERGLRLTLVSSGAISAGMGELKLTRRPTDLAKLQAVAAVGQRRLMDVWAAAFSTFNLPVAQLLLTREDVDDRARFLNARNTIHAAHELGAVPIINENDTISTDELVQITFGDNDILAALVACALRADLLIMLTVTDGILNEQGQPVRLVESAEQAKQFIRAEKSALGKGGMPSKFEAARIVTTGGEALVIADGRQENALLRALDGAEVGTMFMPNSAKRRPSRTRWIGAARPTGSIRIDDGAVRALLENNRSLLPAGVVKVVGSFAPGDVVEVVGPDGSAVARGLTNYGAADVERIRGKKTVEVREMMGSAAYEEVIHRNNLIVV